MIQKQYKREKREERGKKETITKRRKTKRDIKEKTKTKRKN